MEAYHRLHVRQGQPCDKDHARQGYKGDGVRCMGTCKGTGLNRLVRENNELLNKTIMYYYDEGGNLREERE